ncbi:MAG: FHA domain-containing protein, partial [Deltaproteobacteria bacterium]|nr:FHA domain-containing protein [Deltaproteobacteria bacterium]
FNYLPDGAHSQEQPKDGLLLYLFGQKGCVPSIEVFDDIQMTAAPDAISPKDELPKSLTAHYIKKPGAQSSVKGAEIILMLADKIVNKYAIAKAETTIGRGAGSDILLDNPGASRHHAVITEKGGKFTVEDRGSANGTFISGEKITMKELKNGDRIQILNYTLTFKHPQAARPEQTILLTQPVATPPAKQPVQASAPPPVSPEVKTKLGGQSKLVLEDGKEHILKSTVTTIGIGEDMELRLEGKGVEAHQASILRGKGGEFIIVHKGGRTPTKVNGGKIQEHHLKNGDAIEIGSYKINYMVV